MSAEPVAVEVRISVEGEVMPLRFAWHGAWLEIAQVGRRWSDEEGEHWLVMPAAEARVFELTRTLDGLWRATGRGGRVALA